MDIALVPDTEHYTVNSSLDLLEYSKGPYGRLSPFLLFPIINIGGVQSMASVSSPAEAPRTCDIGARDEFLGLNHPTNQASSN
jgi:hypothetical protein